MPLPLPQCSCHPPIRARSNTFSVQPIGGTPPTQTLGGNAARRFLQSPGRTGLLAARQVQNIGFGSLRPLPDPQLRGYMFPGLWPFSCLSTELQRREVSLPSPPRRGWLQPLDAPDCVSGTPLAAASLFRPYRAARCHGSKRTQARSKGKFRIFCDVTSKNSKDKPTLSRPPDSSLAVKLSHLPKLHFG